MKKRPTIPFIDVARFLAPLFVLWAHLGPWWCIEHGSSCRVGDEVWSPVRVTTWVSSRVGLNGNGGHVGVLLFFLVSGFIISHVVRSENRSEFTTKRVFRIAPMLFLGLGIAYAVSRILIVCGLPPILGFEARSISDLFRSMFLLDTIIPSPITNAVTWSLVPEVGFYLILAAVWPTILRWPLGSSYLMVALVALINLSTMAVFPFKPAHYFFMQIEFIIVGRAIYLAWAGLASRRAAMLLGATALTTLAALHFFAPYSRSELFGANSVAISWAIALALFIALIKIRRCPLIFRVVSNSSYSIYLMHIPVGSLVLDVLCLRYGLPIEWAFTIALLAIIATSYATYKLVEVPAQQLGRRIAARWKTSATGVTTATPVPEGV
jgi:peptidoglycan/LPS O-acetylase OafA/YrhL